jgi:hypothetical protein
VRLCRKPTKLQLSLEFAALRTKFSRIPYSEVARSWTPLCGASCLPPRALSPLQRLMVESPRNLSTNNPCLVVEVVVDLSHDASPSTLVTSSGHYVWPAVVLG